MKTSDSTIRADLAKCLPLVLIPFCVLLAFWPTIHADFISWDDDANFLNNPHFRGLSWQNLRWMFTTVHMSNYQPLSWLLTGLGYSIWGMKPLGYHATSLALHGLNSVLFYLLAARLLRLAARGRRNEAAVPFAAAFAALLFALHPLRVESVAWLSGQHDLQAAAFYLLALLCYMKACAGEGRRWRWLMGCTALFAAAMLSKANGVTLPIALLILDYYPLRRLAPDPRRWLQPEQRQVWLEKVPLLAVAVAAGIINLVARHQTAELEPLGLSFRIEQAFYGLAFYIGKTVAPVQLSPMYPIPVDLQLPPTVVGASTALVLGLTAALLHQRRHWPSGLVAWAYYVVTALPVLGLISFSTQLMADRYTYLPCMAWAVLVGGAVLVGRRRMRTQVRHLLSVALGSVLLVLALLSFRQSRLWHDSETLFRYVLAEDQNIPEAHNTLGFILMNQRNTDEAMAEYRRALALKPDYVRAINNLGLALLRQGHTEEAAEQYEKALSLQPNYAFGQNNLGLALLVLGRAAEALPHFEKAVDLAPKYVVAYANLGGALLTLGRVDEAITQYRKALEIRPDYSAAAEMLRQAEETRSLP